MWLHLTDSINITENTSIVIINQQINEKCKQAKKQQTPYNNLRPSHLQSEINPGYVAACLVAYKLLAAVQLQLQDNKWADANLFCQDNITPVVLNLRFCVSPPTQSWCISSKGENESINNNNTKPLCAQGLWKVFKSRPLWHLLVGTFDCSLQPSNPWLE